MRGTRSHEIVVKLAQSVFAKSTNFFAFTKRSMPINGAFENWSEQIVVLPKYDKTTFT